MPAFDHWVVTRFNVPFRSWPGLSTERDWLAHRINLFTSYCLPSVARQTCQDFRWLLLIDRETPPDFLGAITDLNRHRPFEVLLVGPGWGKEPPTFLARASRTEYLVTSRLDNDDAIHGDYVSVLQEAFHPEPFLFLEMPRGLKLHADKRKLYRLTFRSGPFLTLIERRHTDAPQTVYCCNHDRASEHGAIVRLKLDPAWLQIVHSRNATNSIEDGLPVVPLSTVQVICPYLRLGDQSV